MRSPIKTWLLRSALLLAFGGCMLLGGAWLVRAYPGLLDPHVSVRIAAGAPGELAGRLGTLLMREWESNHRFVRIKPVPSAGLRDNLRLLQAGEADVAIVRADAVAGPDWRSIYVLLNVGIVVVLPPRSDVAALTELAGKKLALVSPSGIEEPLVQALLAGGKLRAQDLVPMAAAEVGRAMRERRAEAAIVVTALNMPSRSVDAAVDSINRAMRGKSKVLDIAEAEAIAATLPVFSAGEFTPASLGVNVEDSSESYSTITTQFLLVARPGLGNRTAAEMARALTDLRVRLLSSEPLIAQISAPDLDVPAVVPVHSGVRSYVNGEAPTLTSQATELYWNIGLVMAVLSPALAFAARLFRRNRRTPYELWSERLSAIGEALPEAEAATRKTLMAELSTIAMEAFDALGEEKIANAEFLSLSAMIANLRAA